MGRVCAVVVRVDGCAYSLSYRPLRAGSIDMKEFLHALVLVLRGSHSEKIDMCFTIMDMDGDGM